MEGPFPDVLESEKRADVGTVTMVGAGRDESNSLGRE